MSSFSSRSLSILGLAGAAGFAMGLSGAAAQSILDDVSLGVGAFASVAPAYEGSDEYRVRGIPIAYPVFNNGVSNERSRVAFRGIDDVRLTVVRLGGLDIGPVGGYTFGRDEDLSDKLEGLGDVDGGVVLGGFASYSFGAAFVEGAVSTQVTGDGSNGALASFGAGVDTQVSDRVSVRSSVSAEYASDDFMDRYFSVTAAQSAASVSNYGVFDADGGFKNIAFDTSMAFEATERLTLRAGVGYSRLLGDAADSPISETNNQYTGSLGFTYQF